MSKTTRTFAILTPINTMSAIYIVGAIVANFYEIKWLFLLFMILIVIFGIVSMLIYFRWLFSYDLDIGNEEPELKVRPCAHSYEILPSDIKICYKCGYITDLASL